MEREYTWVSDLPISTCAFVLQGLPAAEQRVFRSLVTPRVDSPPLVALSVLGAGDLASGLARPGWGGQAGCCLGSSSGLQGRDAPFPPVQTFSLCDGSRNLVTTKSAGPVRELRSIPCDPPQSLALFRWFFVKAT